MAIDLTPLEDWARAADVQTMAKAVEKHGAAYGTTGDDFATTWERGANSGAYTGPGEEDLALGGRLVSMHSDSVARMTAELTAALSAFGEMVKELEPQRKDLLSLARQFNSAPPYTPPPATAPEPKRIPVPWESAGPTGKWRVPTRYYVDPNKYELVEDGRLRKQIATSYPSLGGTPGIIDESFVTTLIWPLRARYDNAVRITEARIRGIAADVPTVVEPSVPDFHPYPSDPRPPQVTTPPESHEPPSAPVPPESHEPPTAPVPEHDRNPEIAPPPPPPPPGLTTPPPPPPPEPTVPGQDPGAQPPVPETRGQAAPETSPVSDDWKIRIDNSTSLLMAARTGPTLSDAYSHARLSTTTVRDHVMQPNRNLAVDKTYDPPLRDSLGGEQTTTRPAYFIQALPGPGTVSALKLGVSTGMGPDADVHRIEALADHRG